MFQPDIAIENAGQLAPEPEEMMPMGGMPMGGMPVDELPMGGMPMGGMPTDELPMGGMPVGGMPMGGLPADELGGAGMPMGGDSETGSDLPDDRKPSLEPEISEDVRPRVWNALMDMGGSIFGGNSIQILGDGACNPAAPVKNPRQTVFDSNLKFHPWELYLMGMAPYDELESVLNFMGINLLGSDKRKSLLLGPPGVTDKISPAMGYTTDTKRVFGCEIAESDRLFYKPETLIQAYDTDFSDEPETRQPAFDQAPRYISQLWVLVKDPSLSSEEALVEAENAEAFRREWNQMFYNLTGFRGKVVTSVDGKDDSGYFEFGEPRDAEFEWTGGTAAILPAEDNGEGNGKLTTRLELRDVAEGDVLTFKGPSDGTGDFLPIAVNVLDSSPNAFTVRMRLDRALDGSGATSPTLHQLRGELRFGGKAVQFPASGNLLEDGQWHDYLVPLRHRERRH